MLLREITSHTCLCQDNLVDFLIVSLSRQIAAAISLNLDSTVVIHEATELLSREITATVSLYGQDTALRTDILCPVEPALHVTLDGRCCSIFSNLLRFSV